MPKLQTKKEKKAEDKKTALVKLLDENNDPTRKYCLALFTDVLSKKELRAKKAIKERIIPILKINDELFKRYIEKGNIPKAISLLHNKLLTPELVDSYKEILDASMVEVLICSNTVAWLFVSSSAKEILNVANIKDDEWKSISGCKEIDNKLKAYRIEVTDSAFLKKLLSGLNILIESNRKSYQNLFDNEVSTKINQFSVLESRKTQNNKK